MHKQEKLFRGIEEKEIIIEEDKPTEVKVIRNRFLTAGAVVIEEITRKKWIKPIV
ncbi:MAG: hypothetical protein Q8Q31_01595 [Nanoarchaeota archaeon]|nr:hypothetical protein [Nanoarchaeota archaeon]